MGRHLAKRRSRAAGRRLTRSFVANPYAKDLVEQVGPGLAAYASTRLLQRLTFKLVAKKWPKLAPHAGVISSMATFAAVWFFGGRVRSLARYHVPIVIGSGIATFQQALQTYVPKIGWVTSDIDPDQYISRLPGAIPVLPEVNSSDFDNEDMGDYIEIGDDDPARAAPAAGQAAPGADPEGEGLDIDPEDLGSLGAEDEDGGVFAN